MPLPPRSRSEEDAFVASWAATEDIDSLVEIISEAIDDKRPLLAARLVGLLDEQVEIDDPEVERARDAARFVLHRGEDAADHMFRQLEEAWDEVRRNRRIWRVRVRQRAALRGESVSAPRVGRRLRKR